MHSLREPLVRSLATICAVSAVTVVSGTTAVADTTQVPVAELPAETLCTPDDPVLAEMSGLAVSGGSVYATPDAGPTEVVVELAEDCSVVRYLEVPVDPYDVEDLAVGPDGRLWLADLGDNRRSRDTIALISLDPGTGAGDLYRLTYPDGVHDAETILISATGEPIIVTKTFSGPSSVYRPAGGTTLESLSSPGPTPLEHAGTVRLGPTDTPGGPLPGGSSTMITGGAVSRDGSVVALRTYTDVYLYRVSDDDIVGALSGGPDLRIAVPDEPQGEAVAFTEDGDLLTGSEAVVRGGVVTEFPPIRVWRGATGLLVADPDDVPSARISGGTIAAGAATAVAAIVAVTWWWRRAR